MDDLLFSESSGYDITDATIAFLRKKYSGVKAVTKPVAQAQEPLRGTGDEVSVVQVEYTTDSGEKALHDEPKGLAQVQASPNCDKWLELSTNSAASRVSSLAGCISSRKRTAPSHSCHQNRAPVPCGAASSTARPSWAGDAPSDRRRSCARGR